MSDEPTRARGDLLAWQEAQPKNFFESDSQLQRLLERLMPVDELKAAWPHFRDFGAVVAGPLDRAAIVNNRPHNLPRLARWSPYGVRVEDIEHHPSYDACGKAIYEDGRVIAVYEKPERNLHAQALFYLSSHAGEAGHNCPVACTAGVVKALSAKGSDELKTRWLPGLLESRYSERLDGAQFLTELQGGSDVGANAVRAVPDGDAMGTTRWRIFGEKWFCSNAAADLILMTARVEDHGKGTRGLGLFLVPRHLESGAVNHFHLRRLKDKLGTRSMASSEIDFDGAVAYAVGEVAEGFQSVMKHVISTSRLYNALGCAGIARRARLVATGYARHRRAFGAPVSRYPLMQEMIAEMRATGQALVAGGLELAAAQDAVDSGRSSAEAKDFLRVALNLVKMRSSQHSHQVVLRAIECLGGNGAIETFSVLPRLLRDNVVYENWEGTHNTLIAQTLRDFAQRGMHEGFLNQLEAGLAGGGLELREAMAPAREALSKLRDELSPIIAKAGNNPGLASLMLRGHLETAADLFFASALARDLEHAPSEEISTLRVFVAQHLRVGGPQRNADWGQEVAQVSRLEG